jgi:hypothetical protein
MYCADISICLTEPLLNSRSLEGLGAMPTGAGMAVSAAGDASARQATMTPTFMMLPPSSTYSIVSARSPGPVRVPDNAVGLVASSPMRHVDAPPYQSIIRRLAPRGICRR